MSIVFRIFVQEIKLTNHSSLREAEEKLLIQNVFSINRSDVNYSEMQYILRYLLPELSVTNLSNSNWNFKCLIR